MPGKSVPRYRDPREALRRRSYPAPNGCFLWAGARHGKYGQLLLRGRKIVAHQLAWELANGREVPYGHVIHHECGVPLCVNPSHVRCVTHLEHARLHPFTAERCRRISQAKRGERHHLAKLTEAAVRHIRASGETAATLAKRFGVTTDSIYNVRNHRTWTHV